jgi:hypothetical protein
MATITGQQSCGTLRCSWATTRADKAWAPHIPHASQQKEQHLVGPHPQEVYTFNIMFDRRVVRGNTYASHVLPAEPALLISSSGKPGRYGGGGQVRATM